MHGDLHPGGLCFQMRLGAPEETRGREGLVRGRGALEEPEKQMRSFGEEAPQGEDAGGVVHPKVHKGARCAKCQGLAPGRAHEELVRGEERGAPPEPQARMNSSGGKGGGRVGLGDGCTRRCIIAQNAPSARMWHRNGGKRSLMGGEGRGARALSKEGHRSPRGLQEAEMAKGGAHAWGRGAGAACSQCRGWALEDR